MRRMWIPNSRFITLALSLALLIFINAFSAQHFQFSLPTSIAPWLLGALILTAMLDLFLSRRLPPVKIERQMPGNLAVDKWTSVKLRITHDFNYAVQIHLFDGIDSWAETQNLPLSVLLHPKQTSTTEYHLRPLLRGAASIQKTHVQFFSPLSFWKVQYWCKNENQIKVYPDFVAIANYAILATENHTSQMGIRKKQRRGEGMEFHQLREYRQGDSLRQIDWKATSRHQHLIARDYQEERDQQVVLMIDSGRRMRAKDDELSHFDHALNAMLLVSYIALRQGDNVSLFSFDKNHRWIPPQKGVERVKVLLNGIYDLHANPTTADYINASSKLLQLQPKRSLIVLVTNSRDEDNKELIMAVNLLKKRHLVMVANIREAVLDQFVDAPIHSFDDALNYSGVKQFLHERKEAHRQLLGAGVYALDCTANELAVSVANAYLEIKSAGVL